jgi:hypothetical protein
MSRARRTPIQQESSYVGKKKRPFTVYRGECRTAGDVACGNPPRPPSIGNAGDDIGNTVKGKKGKGKDMGNAGDDIGNTVGDASAPVAPSPDVARPPGRARSSQPPFLQDRHP